MDRVRVGDRIGGMVVTCDVSELFLEGVGLGLRTG